MKPHILDNMFMFTALHRFFQAVIFLVAAASAGSAAASAASAWSAHDRQVSRACIQASGLKNARAVGTPLLFDDSIGMTALLVTGRYPQPHMKNRSASVLCLFDRKKRKATVSPADQLRWVKPASTQK